MPFKAFNLADANEDGCGFGGLNWLTYQGAIPSTPIPPAKANLRFGTIFATPDQPDVDMPFTATFPVENIGGTTAPALYRNHSTDRRYNSNRA
jgi:hypothetical protein